MAVTASIATLPDVALASITSKLSDKEIARLWFCGNRGLNARLGNGGVTDFEFYLETRRAFVVWPNLVSQFRALRSFRFIGPYEVNSKNLRRLQPVYERHLETLPSCLNELVLRGYLKLSRSVMAFLWKRFPNLNILEAPARPDWLDESEQHNHNMSSLTLTYRYCPDPSHLKNLPKGLTKLSLLEMCFADGPIKLPNSITDLEMTPDLNTMFDPAYRLGLEFPPSLTSFNFSAYGEWLYKPALTWPTLHHALTTLKIRAYPDLLTPELMACLPRGLRKLSIFLIANQFNVKLELILSLPPLLESLDFPLGLWEWPLDGRLSVFPPTLTELTKLRDWSPERLALPPLLKSLTMTSSFEHWSDLPSSLTHLSCATSPFLPQGPLPPKLTSLVMGVESTPMDGRLQDFPCTLTDLTLAIVSLDILTNLPSRLTSFTVDMPYLLDAEYEDFEWSSSLPRSLTTLKSALPVNDQWFLSLPPNLSTLHLFQSLLKSPEFEGPYRSGEYLALVPHSVTDLAFHWNRETKNSPRSLEVLKNHHNLRTLALAVPSKIDLWPRSELFHPERHLPRNLGRITFYGTGLADPYLVSQASKIQIELAYQSIVPTLLFRP